MLTIYLANIELNKSKLVAEVKQDYTCEKLGHNSEEHIKFFYKQKVFTYVKTQPITPSSMTVRRESFASVLKSHATAHEKRTNTVHLSRGWLGLKSG
jgi:hypothetical protein